MSDEHDSWLREAFSFDVEAAAQSIRSAGTGDAGGPGSGAGEVTACPPDPPGGDGEGLSGPLRQGVAAFDGLKQQAEEAARAKLQAVQDAAFDAVGLSPEQAQAIRDGQQAIADFDKGRQQGRVEASQDLLNLLPPYLALRVANADDPQAELQKVLAEKQAQSEGIARMADDPLGTAGAMGTSFARNTLKAQEEGRTAERMGNMAGHAQVIGEVAGAGVGAGGLVQGGAVVGEAGAAVGVEGGAVGAEGGAIGAEGGAIGAEGGTLGAEGGVIGAEGGAAGAPAGVAGAEGGALGVEGGAVGVQGGTAGVPGGAIGVEGGMAGAEGGAAGVQGGAAGLEGGAAGVEGGAASVEGGAAGIEGGGAAAEGGAAGAGDPLTVVPRTPLPEAPGLRPPGLPRGPAFDPTVRPGPAPDIGPLDPNPFPGGDPLNPRLPHPPRLPVGPEFDPLPPPDTVPQGPPSIEAPPDTVPQGPPSFETPPPDTVPDGPPSFVESAGGPPPE